MHLHNEQQLPSNFFDIKEVWLTRGAMNYQQLCEPIDVANYYRCGFWKLWPPGKAHYLEANNRPEIYVLLEEKLAETDDGSEVTAPVKEYAQRLAALAEANNDSKVTTM